MIFDPKGQKNETALNRNVAFSKTSVTLIGDLSKIEHTGPSKYIIACRLNRTR